VPHGVELAALRPLLPVFAELRVEFYLRGIYWNNPHHLLHTAQLVSEHHVANLHLLFCCRSFHS